MAAKKKSLATALSGFDTKPSAPKEKPVKADPEPRTAIPKSRQGKKAIAGHFDPEVSRQFKMIGAETDRSLQDMLAEAINDFFLKHGRPPVA